MVNMKYLKQNGAENKSEWRSEPSQTQICGYPILHNKLCFGSPFQQQQ